MYELLQLHQILAEQSWGKLEQKDEKSPIQWKLCNEPFDFTYKAHTLFQFIVSCKSRS